MLPGLAKYKKSPFKQKLRIDQRVYDSGFIRSISPESREKLFKKFKKHDEGWQFGPDGHWHTGPGEISIT